MSWLPNPFKPLQLAGDDNADGGSVKQELKEIGGAIGRQLRGVADFFAPPPPASADECFSAGLSPTLAGVRKDLAELSDCLKSSLSRISRSKAAIGISKVASNFLQLIKEEAEGEKRDRGVGISKEVVDFVKEISQKPECWMDYCFCVDADDFAISQAQAEHICAIQQLVPSLLGLRITLSTNMSERPFWMIYFIILLPTLNEASFKLLSTPEIVKARSKVVEMLRSNRNALSEKDQSHNSSDSDGKSDEMENESGEESSGVTDQLKEEFEKAEKDAADTVICEDDEDDSSNEDDLPSSDLDDDDDDDNDDDDDDDDRKQTGEWQLEGAGSSSSSSSPSGEWQTVEGETSSIWQKVVEFDNYF